MVLIISPFHYKETSIEILVHKNQ